MAENKRPSYVQFTTPKGTFVWPKLNEPDTKFKAEGEYGVKLRLSEDEGAKFLAIVQKHAEAALEAAREELQAKLAAATKGVEKGKLKAQLDKLAAAEPSVKPVFDDDGNETGEVEFNFKMPAQITYKDGPKKGQILKLKPDFFDAKGKVIKSPPAIWGGTIGHVAGEFRPFYTEKAGAGVSLRLKAVQILELASAGGQRDAGAYGFGAAEGGYEAEDEPTSPAGDDDGDAVPAATSTAKRADEF